MTLNTISEDAIPDRMRDIEQWICWREDDRDGKPTKVPIKPYRTSGTSFASSTDPSTWRGFETAITYHRESSSRTDGVGFVFAPEAGIVGVDLDNCRDPNTEALEPWAADIVERLDSYTELSPSGTGVHVLVEGALPAGRNRRGDVEIYDRDRFFTVTGAHLAGTPDEIAHRQDALLAVHYEFVQTDGENEATRLTEAHVASNGAAGVGDDDDTPTQPVGPNSGLHRKFGRDPPAVDDPALEAALHGLSPDEIPDPVPRTLEEVAGPGVDIPDSELLRRAMGSKSGDTIQGLLDGDTSLWTGRDSRYPSQSEADMGLCFFLGFWTGGDPERMDQLFRDSGLYREKWDRRHYGNGATYGAVNVARALLKIDDYYDPPTESTTESETPTPDDLSAQSVPQSAANDESAVAHAQRLATKVQRQECELAVQRERIEEMEAQVWWYRRLLASLGVAPPEEAMVAPEETDIVWGDNPDSDSTMADESEETFGVTDRLRRWFW